MPVIDETAVIARPTAEVFDFLMSAEAESGLGGAFGKAIEPIVQRAQTRVVLANLDKLVILLEQRAA
jgi:hypothetical protein